MSLETGLIALMARCKENNITLRDQILFDLLVGGGSFGSVLTEAQLYAVMNGDYEETAIKIKSLFDESNGKSYFIDPVSGQNVFIDPALNVGLSEMLGIYLNNIDGTLINLNDRFNGTQRIGIVGGSTKRSQGSFVRPADTTPYNANDIVSNGAVFTVSSVGISNNGNGYITGARITTDTGAITPRLRLHLGSTSTAFSVVVDNDPNANTYAKLSADGYLGYIDLPAMVSTGATGASYTQDNTQRVPYECFSSTDLYCIIETLDAFTPIVSQNFDVRLFCEKNS